MMILSSCENQEKNDLWPITAGVSDSLAAYRSKVLSEVQYTLHFNIPADKQQDISARAAISFNYQAEGRRSLYLDFKENAEKIKTLRINGFLTPAVPLKEHLLLDTALLKAGKNEITIDFIAGNGALNRRDDFLYTLFVPDRARTVFPCFDQPDLKAVFRLSLSIPRGWVAIANGSLRDSAIDGGVKTLIFAPTEKLPTYLFSFAAGAFRVAREPWRGKEIEFLFRERDPEKVAASIPAVFEQYKKYIAFYEQWTDMPYPFEKYGLVAIPDFQFGGMEHPGAILLKASALFLPREATEGQLNSRAQLLAHELAHMWFGDLVTMKWFNDVWMKEVFANFMADKATAAPGHGQAFALKFLTGHLPPAYAVDRTLGANPIRQPLNNLENAGTLYGSIIYDKAPVMMRQLEYLMGEEAFRAGVGTYLKTYAYGNASWPDLIGLLNKQTTADLPAWNMVWVNSPGRPVFDDSITYENGTIRDFYLMQKPETGEDRIWPQSFDIALHYEDHTDHIHIDDSLPKQQVIQAINRKKPVLIQFNASGMGYGVWPVDTAIFSRLFSLEDYVHRASAYISLYENMLNGRYIKAAELLDLFASGLERESAELNLRLITDYINTIYWEFLSPVVRKERSERLERQIWLAMQHQLKPNHKKILFECYQNIFETSRAQRRLYRIWKTEQPPAGIALTGDDYTALAFALRLRTDTPGILTEQLTRITDPDRRKRFEIIRPALSFDPAVRDAFFNGLSRKKNRSNESAVAAALGYLHHPLRQPDAERYLKKTLELLPEIQKTGDIFFPGHWLQASFSQYRSASAYQVVKDFLNRHTELQPNLKEKILQATDHLRRTQLPAR